MRYLWKLNFTFIVYEVQSLELVETVKFNIACKIETEGFWTVRQDLVTYLVFFDHTLNTYVIQEIYSDFIIIRHNLRISFKQSCELIGQIPKYFP